MSALDVFMIHTRRDERQYALYRHLARWSKRVGIGLVDYGDWWETVDGPPDPILQAPRDDPWDWMPRINTDAIKRFLEICHVVVIAESDPEADHTQGVRVEIDERRRTPTNPPASIPIAVSFASRRSQQLREERFGTLGRQHDVEHHEADLCGPLPVERQAEITFDVFCEGELSEGWKVRLTPACLNGALTESSGTRRPVCERGHQDCPATRGQSRP